MEKIRVKIEKVDIGKFDVDSIPVKTKDNYTQYCFSKELNVSQYLNKEVYLYSNSNGNYISEIEDKKEDKETKK